MKKACRDEIIDYDLLGNPVRIQFTDRSYTENVYAADGRKLKTSHVTAVPSNNHLALGEMVLLSPSHILSVDSTEYLGNFLFDNGLFKQYHFDGGYFTTTGSEASYKYYVKDHLGSNRILASYNGTIQQETQYYPYGGIHHFSTDQGTQKFKYNGKELDLMHGLNLYDYGARLYDPLIGQFTSIDPLCEKYYSVSPYAYCAGNPVNWVDPDGRDIWELFANGEIIWKEENRDLDRMIFNNTTIDFDYRTINNVGKNGSGQSDYMISVKNYSNADKLYEFITNNVGGGVEAEMVKVAKNNEKFAYIGTSPGYKRNHVEAWQNFCNNGFINTKELSVIEFVHSHPGDNVFPSGIPNGPKQNIGDDWNTIKNREKQYPNAKQYLYIPMIESTGLRGYGFKIPLQSSLTIDDFDIYENKKREIQDEIWK